MTMTSGEMKAKAVIVLRAIIRGIWVFISNLYAIPAHLLMVGILLPLRDYAPEIFNFIDGLSFRWLQCLVAHWMYSAGYKVAECGDSLSDLEDVETLVIVNHQSTADVPSIMYALQFHNRVLDKIMWIMDVMFKHTNFGVVSQMRGDFFIQQGKETRALQGPLLQKHITDYYIPRKREWIVVFPEGHFFYKQKLRSQAYGRKNGLPHLEHCLLPRAGAIHSILQSLAPKPKDPKVNPLDHKEKTIKWFVDITLAYPKGLPLNLQTIIGGHRSPMTTTLLYRKYPINEVPLEENELLTWLYQRFVEKDQLLDEFYKTGKFPKLNKDGEKIGVHEAKTLELSYKRRFGLHLFYMLLTYVQWSIIWWVISTLWSVVSFIF